MQYKIYCQNTCTPNHITTVKFLHFDKCLHELLDHNKINNFLPLLVAQQISQAGNERPPGCTVNQLMLNVLQDVLLIS